MDSLPKIDGRPDRGAVLLLAMVFMLMLALIAATVVQTAILQLHMAGNDQFLEEAFHKVQAVVAELSQDAGNFSLETAVGRSNCPAGDTGLDCDLYQLPTPVSARVPAGVELDYRVTRQEPLLWKGFPIRESQDTVSSSNSFDAATFEISVRIDGSERRLGSAHVVQGVVARVPAFR
jgi:Tfp pilus assembly protein PilX